MVLDTEQHRTVLLQLLESSNFRGVEAARVLVELDTAVRLAVVQPPAEGQPSTSQVK